MKSAKLVVIYPRPKDVDAFENIYQTEHVPLAVARLSGKTKMVATKVLGSPQGTPPFYRVAEVYFPSMQALEAVRRVGRRPGDVGPRRKDFLGRTAHFPGRRGRDFHVYQELACR